MEEELLSKAVSTRSCLKVVGEGREETRLHYRRIPQNVILHNNNLYSVHSAILKQAFEIEGFNLAVLYFALKPSPPNKTGTTWHSTIDRLARGFRHLFAAAKI